jgi:hypothetical protein
MAAGLAAGMAAGEEGWQEAGGRLGRNREEGVGNWTTGVSRCCIQQELARAFTPVTCASPENKATAKYL